MEWKKKKKKGKVFASSHIHHHKICIQQHETWRKSAIKIDSSFFTETSTFRLLPPSPLPSTQGVDARSQHGNIFFLHSVFSSFEASPRLFSQGNGNFFQHCMYDGSGAASYINFMFLKLKTYKILCVQGEKRAPSSPNDSQYIKFYYATIFPHIKLFSLSDFSRS